MGQVVNPGEYPLSGHMTVVQALALSGGLREFAKAGSIVVIREGSSGPISIPVNYKKLERGEDLARNIVIRVGDTILVP